MQPLRRGSLDRELDKTSTEELAMDFIHSFIHSFVQQIIVGHLLHVSTRSKKMGKNRHISDFREFTVKEGECLESNNHRSRGGMMIIKKCYVQTHMVF